MQGKTAKIGCGLFGVSKNFYNLNTLTYWRLRYGFSYRSLRKEGGGWKRASRIPANESLQTVFAGIFVFGGQKQKIKNRE